MSNAWLNVLGGFFIVLAFLLMVATVRIASVMDREKIPARSLTRAERQRWKWLWLPMMVLSFVALLNGGLFMILAVIDA